MHIADQTFIKNRCAPLGHRGAKPRLLPLKLSALSLIATGAGRN